MTEQPEEHADPVGEVAEKIGYVDPDSFPVGPDDDYPDSDLEDLETIA